MKSGHFIITYLAPIKKLKKIEFWKIGPKNQKCRYKKSSMMKNGPFTITYLAPIKKSKKFEFWKFLDL